MRPTINFERITDPQHRATIEGLYAMAPSAALTLTKKQYPAAIVVMPVGNVELARSAVQKALEPAFQDLSEAASGIDSTTLENLCSLAGGPTDANETGISGESRVFTADLGDGFSVKVVIVRESTVDSTGRVYSNSTTAWNRK